MSQLILLVVGSLLVGGSYLNQKRLGATPPKSRWAHHFAYGLGAFMIGAVYVPHVHSVFVYEFSTNIAATLALLVGTLWVVTALGYYRLFVDDLHPTVVPR